MILVEDNKAKPKYHLYSKKKKVIVLWLLYLDVCLAGSDEDTHELSRRRLDYIGEKVVNRKGRI